MDCLRPLETRTVRPSTNQRATRTQRIAATKAETPPANAPPNRNRGSKTKQGARVIALARRVLPAHLDGPELRAMAREEAEGGMEFMGFAVFQVRPRARALFPAPACSLHLACVRGRMPLKGAHAMGAAARAGIAHAPLPACEEPTSPKPFFELPPLKPLPSPRRLTPPTPPPRAPRPAVPP